uniref:Uncharacterized protein n=1 Tax=Melopsittacus undulatus TaxID=13146 RepID=A0A8V5GLI0_MELUD
LFPFPLLLFPSLPFPPTLTPPPSPPSPTRYLHDVILGLHHQLLRCEVIHIQGHLPAVRGLPDLGDAAAELPAQRLPIGRAGGRQQGALPGQQTEVAGPGAAARPLVPVLRDMGHPEGLVEQPAPMVPVPERVPAGAAQEGEGDAALGHGAAAGRGGPMGPYEGGRGLFLGLRLNWLLMEITAGHREGTRNFPGMGAASRSRIGWGAQGWG